jgi:hypothetical protein
METQRKCRQCGRSIDKTKSWYELHLQSGNSVAICNDRCMIKRIGGINQTIRELKAAGTSNKKEEDKLEGRG